MGTVLGQSGGDSIGDGQESEDARNTGASNTNSKLSIGLVCHYGRPSVYNFFSERLSLLYRFASGADISDATTYIRPNLLQQITRIRYRHQSNAFSSL